MDTARVITGRISDPTHIELDSPLIDVAGRIEIIIRPAPAESTQSYDVFDYFKALQPGHRSKSEIDDELRRERDAWDAAS